MTRYKRALQRDRRLDLNSLWRWQTLLTLSTYVPTCPRGYQMISINILCVSIEKMTSSKRSCGWYAVLYNTIITSHHFIKDDSQSYSVEILNIHYQVNISTASSNVVWQTRFSVAPGGLDSCSGLKVHLPFRWVDWNPEHFHIWKTACGQWDEGDASYLLVVIVMDGHYLRLLIILHISIVHKSTGCAPGTRYNMTTDHGRTCSVRPPPASTSLWRSYFFREYWWMSDRFLRSLHPSGVLWRGPSAAARL